MLSVWSCSGLILFFGVLFGMTTLNGCVDKCLNQSCLNGGECLDGYCECPSGYYGINCENTTGGGAGYICSGGNCNYVASGGTYSSLSACQSSCGGGSSAGYICSGGNCSYVSNGAVYSTSSACAASCGNLPSGPATGKFYVKIYYVPAGACSGTATSSNHTLRFYTFCEGNYTNGIYAGIWSNGNDAGGAYRECTFGINDGGLCQTSSGNFVSHANKLYRLEWTMEPDVFSYPQSCLLSGVANIDFQDQVKNVVLKWN